MRCPMMIAASVALCLSAGCSIRIDVDEGPNEPVVVYAADRANRSPIRVGYVAGKSNEWNERYFIERSGGQTVLRVETEVKPAWLGVYFREIGKSSARKLGVDRRCGLYVRRIVKGSPAAEAGVRAKDIIVSVDGIHVPRVKDFRNIAREVVAPGQTVTMRVLRGPRGAKREHAIAVCMGETEKGKHVSKQRVPLEHAYAGGMVRLGVLFATVPDEWATRLFDTAQSSVVVGDVLRGSPAHAAGLRRGDRVLSVDGVPVSSADDAKAAVQTKRTTDAVMAILIERRHGGQLMLQVAPPTRGWENAWEQWETIDPRWQAVPNPGAFESEDSSGNSRARWA